jgi:hypothetical protein
MVKRITQPIIVNPKLQTNNMKLHEFATEMASKGNFIKASFGGFAGSGKTKTASEFLAGAYKELGHTKPLLIIDNEKGSRFLIPFFKKELPNTKIIVKDTRSLADILQAMQFLQNGEIDALFIDSLSKVWYQYVSDYKSKNRITFMTLQDWGKILPAWQEEFSDRFVSIDGSIVFTGRGGFTYEKEEDEKDEQGRVKKKGQFVKSGVKMKMAGETPFEPDLNVWMEQEQELQADGRLKIWREAQILKDRSDTIDGKVFENPTYNDFRPVIRFLQGLPVGTIAGESNRVNLAPAENWEAYERKQQRIIEMEKITALFDTYGYSGTLSKEQKAIKALSIEKIFGTTSITEIEKMDPTKLGELRENLSVLLKEITEEEDKFEYIKNFKLPGAELPFS